MNNSLCLYLIRQRGSTDRQYTGPYRSVVLYTVISARDAVQNQSLILLCILCVDESIRRIAQCKREDVKLYLARRNYLNLHFSNATYA